MTPEARPDLAPAAGTNGTHREPDILARARRVLSGDVRPGDYLPVTADVCRAVERDMASARDRGKGRQLAPEVEPRQRQEELLSFHHGGQAIVFTEDDRGIIVLAVGGDEVKAVLATFGPTDAGRLIFDAPPTWK